MNGSLLTYARSFRTPNDVVRLLRQGIAEKAAKRLEEAVEAGEVGAVDGCSCQHCSYIRGEPWPTA